MSNGRTSESTLLIKFNIIDLLLSTRTYYFKLSKYLNVISFDVVCATNSINEWTNCWIAYITSHVTENDIIIIYILKKKEKKKELYELCL